MKLSRLSQFGFPFHPPGPSRGNPAMQRLRIAGRSMLYASQPRWKRNIAKVGMVALWPFGAALTAVRAGRDYSATPGQALDAWWLAMRHNVPPLEYYLHRLWDPVRRERLDDYLYWTENGVSLEALNRAAGWRSGPSAVADKRLFYAFCSEHGLQTPSIFAVWRKGAQIEGGELPSQDLWIKPSRGQSGNGAECWRWHDGLYRRDGQVFTPQQMISQIARHSQYHSETLVQAVVHSHADFAPLIGDAPLCARILTARGRTGLVEIVDAMAIWPRDGRVITQGGNIAMVDIDTGRLGAVYEALEGSEARKLHGKALPDWAVVLEALKGAHAHLPHYVFLGWDVAFGRDGASLLETNSGWGAFHFQVVPDHAIADTAFAAIVAEYL